MTEFPSYEQMAKNVADKALDEFLYDGKSIREWMKIIGEQEPKTGHWIDNGNGTISCSHCHTWFKKDEQFRFFLSCPYCKADMKEE